MTTATDKPGVTDKPIVVTDPVFRNGVRDLLVELPSRSPGLGLRVSGDERAVVVYPRAGKAISTLDNLLALTWYEAVVVDGGAPKFNRLKRADVERFFGGLSRTHG